jgi:hypothetical protein
MREYISPLLAMVSIAPVKSVEKCSKTRRIVIHRQ